MHTFVCGYAFVISICMYLCLLMFMTIGLCMCIYVFLFVCTEVHMDFKYEYEYELSVCVCKYIHACAWTYLSVCAHVLCTLNLFSALSISTQIFLLKLFSLSR